MDNLLTPKELAERLKVSEQTIGRKTQEGIIPAALVIPGSKRHQYRYDFDAVVEALQPRGQRC